MARKKIQLPLIGSRPQAIQWPYVEAHTLLRSAPNNGSKTILPLKLDFGRKNRYKIVSVKSSHIWQYTNVGSKIPFNLKLWTKMIHPIKKGSCYQFYTCGLWQGHNYRPCRPCHAGGPTDPGGPSRLPKNIFFVVIIFAWGPLHFLARGPKNWSYATGLWRQFNFAWKIFLNDKMVLSVWINSIFNEYWTSIEMTVVGGRWC